MTKSYPGEIWKDVKFNFEFTNDYRLEVSSFGRLRTFNKLSDGNVINGSLVNGYPIIRLKFYKPREAKTHASIVSCQQQVLNQNKIIKLLLQQGGETNAEITEATKKLSDAKKKLAKQFKTDTKERTIYYQSLIHLLVAQYFCLKYSAKHSVVSHLDFNKLNNRSSNLKWMTREENIIHQQKSPFVIEGRKDRKFAKNSKVSKLTVTKVMLLKKLLKEGKPLRTLVKQFKVTDTQILRIKRGENWADIPAAN